MSFVFWKGLILSFVTAISIVEVAPSYSRAESVEIKVADVDPKEVAIGDRIRVKVDKLTDAIAQDKQFNPRNLTLYLDGRVLKGVKAEPVGDPGQNQLEFILKPTRDSKEGWLILLRNGEGPVRHVPISVGFDDKQQIPALNASMPPTLNLRIYHSVWFWICTVGFLVVIVLFVWLAVTTNIIRDRVVNRNGTDRPPYSLGWFQMAFWFFVVLSSLVYIRLTTCESDVLTEQALIILGIGTGTALGAAMIQGAKQGNADREVATLRSDEAKLRAEIANLNNRVAAINAALRAAPNNQADIMELTRENSQIAEKEARLVEVQRQIQTSTAGLIKNPSQGFLLDLLTDVNGISLHRFQMLIWTLVFGLFFLVDVYRNLQMPQFSTTQLTLLGISSGTYLGFKIPERQS